MRHARVAIGVVLLASGATVAQATPIPIPTTSELILNFDLTSQTPSPPYDEVVISFVISDIAGGQTVFRRGYTDLNGGGVVFFSSEGTVGFPGDSGITQTTTITVPDDPAFATILDGVFSIGLRVEPFVAGAANLVSATAEGSIAGDGSTGPVPGEVVAGVPEPATLSLMALGLVGIARRLRQSTQATIARP